MDRLDPARYSDDEPFQVRLEPHPRDQGASASAMEAWIAERLVDRLRHVALAYELPLLGRLPVTDSMSYPEIQLAAVEDELEFILEVVSDHVLREALAPLRHMIGAAIRNPRGLSLVVEAP